MTSDRLAELRAMTGTPAALPLAAIAEAYVCLDDAQDERYLSIDTRIAHFRGKLEPTLGPIVEAERRAVTRGELAANEARFEAAVRALNGEARGIRESLAEARDAGTPVRNDAEARLAQAMHDVHVRRFQEGLAAFKRLTERYRGVVKERTVRMIQVADATLGADEAERMVQRGMTQEQVSALLDDTVLELQERYEGVRRLERTVMELADLFEVMAFMAESDQVVLNRIQARVEAVRAEAQRSTAVLGVAEVDAARGRRQQVACLLIALGALAAGVVVLGTRL